jgi:deazaflavin-dependent oxidoreductase (nitroreductase family)
VKFYNRLVSSFAGRRLYALLRHRGRRSGKNFATPVMAWPTAGGMLIPLAWGSQTDWYRNLMAAQGCEVQLKGRWQSEQVFGAEGIALEPDDVVYVDYLLWPGNGESMSLDLDVGGDGTVDETLQVDDVTDEFAE